MLSDRRIIEEMEKGNIVIEPFKSQNLGTNSYDLSLGEWFCVPTYRNWNGSKFGIENRVFNFWEEASAKDFWSEPYKETDSILIYPGETVLAHTQEVVGGTNGITTSMRARSSIARSCISICRDAGVGDVGYIGIWTMEITNHSHSHIRIPIGVRLAQMEFYDVGPTLKEYTGKYGFRREDWNPNDMKPKLFFDREYTNR